MPARITRLAGFDAAAEKTNRRLYPCYESAELALRSRKIPVGAEAADLRPRRAEADQMRIARGFCGRRSARIGASSSRVGWSNGTTWSAAISISMNQTKSDPVLIARPAPISIPSRGRGRYRSHQPRDPRQTITSQYRDPDQIFEGGAPGQWSSHICRCWSDAAGEGCQTSRSRSASCATGLEPWRSMPSRFTSAPRSVEPAAVSRIFWHC